MDTKMLLKFVLLGVAVALVTDKVVPRLGPIYPDTEGRNPVQGSTWGKELRA